MTVVRADQIRMQHFALHHRHDENVLPFEQQADFV